MLDTVQGDSVPEMKRVIVRTGGGGSTRRFHKLDDSGSEKKAVCGTVSIEKLKNGRKKGKILPREYAEKHFQKCGRCWSDA